MLSVLQNILDYLNVSDYTKAVVMNKAIKFLIGRRCIEESMEQANNR